MKFFNTKFIINVEYIEVLCILDIYLFFFALTCYDLFSIPFFYVVIFLGNNNMTSLIF